MQTTTDQAVDPIPPLKPSQRYAQLEVDVFCYECSYNLHGQPVTRDERLGIFICRCPECGRFHPAGTGLTAIRPWANRLATVLLVLWVCFVIFAAFLLGLSLAGVAGGHIDNFSYRKLVTAKGEPAVWTELPNNRGWQVVRKGTTQPVYNYHFARTLEKQPEEDSPNPWSGVYNNNVITWRWRALFAGGAIFFSTLTGMLIATFLWFWSRRAYRRVLLFPFVVAAIQLVIIALDDDYTAILTWVICVSLAYAAVEMTFMNIGLRIGRPIARTFLRMFVPPRPRQHFAFLWKADGKQMPAVQ